MSLQSVDRPAGCVVLLTPARAELVFRALCVYLVSRACKPGDRAELAELLELLSDGESYERAQS